MAAHQNDRALAELVRQRMPHGRTCHQHVGRAEALVLIVNGSAVGRQKRCAVKDRLQGRFRNNRKRHNGRRMRVDHGIDVGPLLVDLAVNEALEVAPAFDRRIDRLAVQIEYDHVLFGDEIGRQRPRLQIMARVTRIADADVPEGIDNALVSQDSVGCDQILEHLQIQGLLGLGVRRQ